MNMSHLRNIIIDIVLGDWQLWALAPILVARPSSSASRDWVRNPRRLISPLVGSPHAYSDPLAEFLTQNLDMSAILVDQPVLARSNSVHGTDGAGSTVVPSLSHSSTSTAVNGSSFGENAGIDPSGASRASGMSSEVRRSCEWIYEPSLISLLVLSAT